MDAGKTISTEPVLYYARRIHHLGVVDRGDTVTDYLSEERERGISIVTASVSLSWRSHVIHLFDTTEHDTMNVVNMLISKRFYTFSPPAFGIVKRPGDDFYPWQCVLAEEAPVMATTVYRQAVDKADFECVIDESGKLYQPRTTTSIRRYHPKDNPPTSLGYLKASVKQLLENLNPNSKSLSNHHSLFISPVHQNLMEARLKRLKLEEKMLMQAEKLDMLERIRKPLPKWYVS
ncbi:putative translation elongation factor G [Schistosoma mansoni]|uniref:putative translation elongation factor G n=1 Tax=Schistosoma mansoni TaxID=6183 RepID=UPI0001A61C9D|nr:putative translation elongation factor G [Schistosoma mansoni]|eukprot:XP_018653099.1 putative translation elongation factor G [Schistosoma mansoni]